MSGENTGSIGKAKLQSLLCSAVKSNTCADLIQLLLSEGASVSLKILEVAAKNNPNADIVKMLLKRSLQQEQLHESSAIDDKQTKDRVNLKLLELAAKHNPSAKVVNILLKRSPNTQQKQLQDFFEQFHLLACSYGTYNRGKKTINTPSTKPLSNGVILPEPKLS